MNRDNIEDVLLEIGIPAGNRGFDYIADAIEYIDENGRNISVTKGLYPYIAEKRGTDPNKVERCIRHSLEIARNIKNDNYEAVEYYIGFINTANYSSLVMLHQRIKKQIRNEYEVLQKDELESILKIREIVRQEIRIALKEIIS